MPSWRDIKNFCEHDDWELYKETDHVFYRKFMPDGTMKRTKVSKHWSDEVKGNLWHDILKKQLMVDLEYFNRKKAGRK